MASPGQEPQDQPVHFLSGKKIIVAGAGIGGLAFAIALRKQWPAHSTSPPPSLAIYERETQANATGRDGYSMSIRSDPPGGVQALQHLGLLDTMVGVALSASSDSQAGGFCIWDPSGRQLLKIQAKVPPGLPVGGLRIARKKLRTELLAAAEAAGCRIAWNTGCEGLQRRDQDGRLDVKLVDGRTDDCDLFVAADGAKSKIRAQLRPDDVLVYTGATMIEGISRFGDKRPPKPLDRDWGIVQTGTGFGLFASPVDDHSAVWAVSFRPGSPRESMSKKPLSEADAAALLAEVRGYAPMFSPWFSTLLDASDAKEIGLVNTKDKHPFAHTDARYPEVVFIGDANHAVTPFAGNGANMALSDGWDLATYLCSSNSLAEAIKQYDEVVVPRSKTVWKHSHHHISGMLATGWKAWFLWIVLRIMLLFSWRSVNVTTNDTPTEGQTS